MCIHARMHVCVCTHVYTYVYVRVVARVDIFARFSDSSFRMADQRV